MIHHLSMAERVVKRFALAPNSSGAKLTIGRGYYGPTVNLISTGQPVDLTEEDQGWMSEPGKLKPRQFGKLELERRFLSENELPPGAVEAFKSSKSNLGKHDLATVFAVSSVFVNQDFKSKGYGLAMYLKALELVSSRGYWLVNDTKRSTSGSAATTWKALFRYAQKTLEGPPPPQKLLDPETLEYILGYPDSWPSLRVLPTHRPAMAAFGLNGAGKKAMEDLV
jgi:hypothetical protein